MEIYFELAYSSYGTEIFSTTQYRLPLFSWFELLININPRRAAFSLKNWFMVASSPCDLALSTPFTPIQDLRRSKTAVSK
jgi:hypothetical protein